MHYKCIVSVTRKQQLLSVFDILNVNKQNKTKKKQSNKHAATTTCGRTNADDVIAFMCRPTPPDANKAAEAELHW